VPLELAQDRSSKKPKISVAEETHPKRSLITAHKEKHRKPAGRKKQRGDRDATYHNWFTPLLWSTIDQASKAVGWQMSPTKIVKMCQARNPELFAGLTRESVKRWIDRTGEQPKWSDAALKRVAAGNMPGHALGRPQGALVSILTMSGV
jgi:hypothetical protein